MNEHEIKQRYGYFFPSYVKSFSAINRNIADLKMDIIDLIIALIKILNTLQK